MSYSMTCWLFFIFWLKYFFCPVIFLCSTSAWAVISFATEPSSFLISTSRCGYCYTCDFQSLGIFESSDSPLLTSVSWSGYMSGTHIALQELQAVAMMLHWMVFQLSGKLVALCLDSSTAEAYLCNQGASVFPFMRLSCGILGLTDKDSITLIPACISVHLNVEADYLSWGWFLPELHFLPCIAQAAFHLCGPLWGGSVCFLPYHSMSAYITLETVLPLGTLGLNAFNHPWM